MSINSFSKQAQLAEASYADFWDEDSNQIITDPQDAQLALINIGGENKGFSSSQAADFASHWSLAHHIPNEPTGFSDTVFESLDTPGKSTLPIRLTVFFTQLITDLILSCLAETCLQFAPLVYINLWNESEQSYNLF